MKNVKWCQLSRHSSSNPWLNLCISLVCLNAKDLGTPERYYSFLFGEEAPPAHYIQMEAQESQGQKDKNVHSADENSKLQMPSQKGRKHKAALEILYLSKAVAIFLAFVQWISFIYVFIYLFIWLVI